MLITMICKKFSQKFNILSIVRKTITVIAVTTVLFISIGCSIQSSETNSTNKQSSSETSSAPAQNEARPVDKNGKPLPYYLDENNKPHYFTLPTDLQLCNVTSKDDYHSILNTIRGLNQYERIEESKYYNKGNFDLSVHTLLSAIGKIESSSQEDTARWNTEYPSTDTYAGPGVGYISETSMKNYINSVYSDKPKNIDFSSLQYYYCAPIKHYVVPMADQYVNQLPVLHNFSAETNLIKAEFSFLYYVYYDTPEDGENTISNVKGNVVGEFVKGEAVIDQSKLNSLASYEFIFIKNDNILQLDSIKQISNN